MKRGQYFSYLENKELMNNCINDYVNGNQTQQKICEKYKISLNTFKGYFRLYKTKNNLMEGGQMEKPKKTVDNIFKKKTDTSQTGNKDKANNDNNNIMEIMYNASRKGKNNKHSGFTDIIEQNEKKKEQEKPKQQSNKKVYDLEELYGTNKLLNELEEKRKNA